MMRDYLFLIGNGINRAIDDDKFRLESGMEEAWEDIEGDEDLKKIIYDCLGEERCPKNEVELENVQNCLFRLERIRKDLGGLPNALSEKIMLEDFKKRISEFNESYISYLFAVAHYFYQKVRSCTNDKECDRKEKLEKLNNFTKGLADFIKTKKDKEGITVHIATLNYDSYLYETFLDEHAVLKCLPSRTYLGDGFSRNGFIYENLPPPQCGNWFGNYLHLHGSPLFYTGADGKIYKSKRSYSLEDNKPKRSHIVLCNPSQKLDLIKQSPLLDAYFNRVEKLISQSKKIIVLGYGGRDEHINQAIRDYKNSDTSIIVVQRKGCEEKGWSEKFGIEPLKLTIRDSYDSILDFDFSTIDK